MIRALVILVAVLALIKYGTLIIKWLYSHIRIIVSTVLLLLFLTTTGISDSLFKGSHLLDRYGYSQDTRGFIDMCKSIYQDRQMYVDALEEYGNERIEIVKQRVETRPYSLGIVDLDGYQIDSLGNRVSDHPLDSIEIALLYQEYNLRNGTAYTYRENLLEDLLK